MVGRPPNVYPKSFHDCGDVFRPTFKPDGTVELQSLGRFQEINGKRYGNLNADWLNNVRRQFQNFDTKFADRLESLLREYIRMCAEKSAAVAWHDMLEQAKEIDAAAKALHDAIDKSAPSTSLIWQRLESIEETGWSRDDFYPRFSQLRRRAHLLREELQQEHARGETLESGAAWSRCVFGLAELYLAMTGEEPTVTEISRENSEVAKTSGFSKFAFTAINQVPPDIIEREFANGANINSLSRKMRDPLWEWKRSRGFPARRNRKPR